MSTLHDFLLIFVPLFVVMDIPGTLPIYVGLTMPYTDEQRRHIARRATLAAGITGVLFIFLGQAILNFLSVQVADFQIAGGILLVILSVLDLLSSGKPAVNDKAVLGSPESFGIVPLAVPLIVGPATLTTSLLLVATFTASYDARFGAPYGQLFVMLMVATALIINLLLLFIGMYFSNRIVAIVGKNAMAVMNKIVMILLAGIAVSLIRRGIVSIVLEMSKAHS